ncbi:MAG: low temperature requirement protein A, partial [Burkholderiales bacterium]|nr:low temperature requirement protein A [Burkholderiales bacterium]
MPPHLREGRRASWFELFFDLAFVTAVAQLTAALSHHYDAAGLAQFVVALLLLWWTWLGHTFHSTRFDEDRPDQHLLGMLQIVAVIVIAFGAGAAFGERGAVFAAGMAALKLLLLAAYLRERRRSGAGRLAASYALIYGLQVALWLASIALAGPARWSAWGLVLVLDIASPFAVAKHTHGYPPHPEHLPERFGLFTIIVMGEGVASALHALLHAGAIDGRSAALALLGLVLAFFYWVGYFERVRAQRELHVADAAAARRLRGWAYGHVPLLIGICLGAAGLVVASGHEQPPLAPLITGAGITLAMMGLTLIGAAQAEGGRPRSRSAAHALVALLPLL